MADHRWAFMLEIEIKSPTGDAAGVEARLRELGAEFEGEVGQSDLYLAHPCRDFGSTDEALRVRQEGDRYTLHYKGPKVDQETKTREEISVPLSHPEEMRMVLQRLGFREFATVEKTRRVYMLREVGISLDHVAGLGDFVELEVQGEDAEAGRKLLYQRMSELGLERTERSSYLELLLQKQG